MAHLIVPMYVGDPPLECFKHGSSGHHTSGVPNWRTVSKLNNMALHGVEDDDAWDMADTGWQYTAQLLFGVSFVSEIVFKITNLGANDETATLRISGVTAATALISAGSYTTLTAYPDNTRPCGSLISLMVYVRSATTVEITSVT